METLSTSREWAEQQFGSCQLGDRRRNQRAVAIATAMLDAPNASIPQQMKSPQATKAAYRFFSNEAWQYADLIGPQWEQTRTQMRQAPLVLLVQDLTELDYSPYAAQIAGLGLIGDNREQGILVHTVLGVLPTPRQVLGIAYQEPFFRQPHPPGETRTQRAKRPKESDVWLHAVQAIGPCPPGGVWVHVGDRGADIYGFFAECLRQKCLFLVRVCQNRRMFDPQGEVNYLRTYAASLPAVSHQRIDVPEKGGRPARQAQVCLAFAPLTLSAGWMNGKSPPLATWTVRVWEPHPPPQVEPLEWILLTVVPTHTVEQAWERVAWYRCRWLVEDFHQCLKTGCRIEQRPLEEATSLLRLLALQAPVAVQLLGLREQTRLQPKQLAQQTLPADMVQLVAQLAKRSPQALTLQEFWRFVAQQGGYRGRTRDGPPGWKSIWYGWSYVQTLLRGFRLASSSHEP